VPRRPPSASRLAHAIADELSSDGFHGEFTYGRFERHDHEWHFYRAEFFEAFELKSLHTVISPFGQWLESFYSSLAQISVRLTLVNHAGEVVDNNWRSLTRTANVRATFEPEYIDSKADQWELSKNYRAEEVQVTGINVELSTSTE
jgi:hypothetical protein